MSEQRFNGYTVLYHLEGNDERDELAIEMIEYRWPGCKASPTNLPTQCMGPHSCDTDDIESWIRMELPDEITEALRNRTATCCGRLEEDCRCPDPDQQREELIGKEDWRVIA